ncbi:MAG: GGDEF domain-containing protein [Proteobacteria bacterium]|nr:GGDEF domain-containing protein [Pseudomonadota bacterium]
MLPFLKREGYAYALAFIDVDNFKQVNDTKGHAEGDRILTEVARIMKDSLRESDMVARLGGDEFIIFLPRADAEKSKSVLRALKEKLDSVVRENDWPIGFSIGTGVFDGGLPIETAIIKADTMMYQAKKNGKNSIFFLAESPV